MTIVNGKRVLKIGNEYIQPGEQAELPDDLAKRLADVGLVKIKPKKKG